MDKNGTESQKTESITDASGNVTEVLVTDHTRIGEKTECRYSSSFILGRDPSCDVQQDNTVVSRRHAEVYFDGTTWCIRDLESVNGTYVNNQRIRQSRITKRCKVQLGQTSGYFWIEPVHRSYHAQVHDQDSVTKFVHRYFETKDESLDPQHAEIVREAFQRLLKKQVRKYGLVIVISLVLLVVATGTAVYQQVKLNHRVDVAADIFYTMKSLEVQIMTHERLYQEIGKNNERKAVLEKRHTLNQLREKYDRYVETGPVWSSHTPEERVIFHVARLFGECELTMPKSFVDEVKAYIAKWQSSTKLKSAISRAERYDFLAAVKKAMPKNHLPVQFYYLALQESEFRIDAVGKKTRHGIAKGPWQFIPKTAIRYGLKTGPMADQRIYDPDDERHDVVKSTYAAARYLKYIYSTEAQASGLLVMASYNWGEHRVIKLLEKMPENPRERNFWDLIKKHKIPKETYGYVLAIFSAAVIGENPALFGFDFKSPFAGSENI